MIFVYLETSQLIKWLRGPCIATITSQKFEGGRIELKQIFFLCKLDAFISSIDPENGAFNVARMIPKKFLYADELRKSSLKLI